MEPLDIAKDLRDGRNLYLKKIFTENARYCVQRLTRDHSCSREDARDIYVDAVINFREKVLKGQIEHLTDVKHYLLATCRNMFLARLRRAKRESKAISELKDESFIFDTDNGQEMAIAKEKMIDLTQQAFSQLGSQCQEILKQFYFQHYSLDDIAQHHKMANANVAKVSKARCLQKIVRMVSSSGPINVLHDAAE